MSNFKNEILILGEKKLTSAMNLQAAINELQLPDYVITALAHAGILGTSNNLGEIMLSSDDVFELAAKIEHFRDSDPHN